ncbi:hypothetical protein AJ80_06776 [Polytolypa hystricis UAMH7299]|uniref:Uncharacterized protein n=1 Tax=Polytolypa hystricis (strain UAMH7299) TaxID=1447883 RepID=A0A2B7XUF0_POLH7|nr:hypothetical protein AJ80_06776 [Polytolypa hystricis UAMH7299]
MADEARIHQAVDSPQAQRWNHHADNEAPGPLILLIPTPRFSTIDIEVKNSPIISKLLMASNEDGRTSAMENLPAAQNGKPADADGANTPSPTQSASVEQNEVIQETLAAIAQNYGIKMPKKVNFDLLKPQASMYDREKVIAYRLQ